MGKYIHLVMTMSKAVRIANNIDFPLAGPDEGFKKDGKRQV